MAPLARRADTREAARRKEERLALALANRDPRALEEVYERYGRACFGFLVNLLRDREAAEDVQQQVFLEVWQRAPTYERERASLLTWIMTIARSRGIDHLRRRVPEPAGTLAGDERQPATDDTTDELVDRWRVAALLEGLQSEEAMLLRMRFYEDLPQTEIAERTGIPLGTVKMRMVKALRRLRELVDEE